MRVNQKGNHFMKNKSKFLSLLSLSFLLFSCSQNSNSVKSDSLSASSKSSVVSKNDSTGKESQESHKFSASETPSISSSIEEVEPTSIKITNSIKSLKLGEVVQIECSFEPSNAKKDFTLSTDDSDYIEILDGNKIRAIKKTPLGKKVSLVASTGNDLENVIRFTISSDSINQEKIEKIVEKLQNSQKLGTASLSDGTLSVDVEEDGKITQTGDYDYKIFEGGLHSEVVSSVFEDNATTETVSSRLIKGSRYMKANATKSGNEWVANTNSFDSLSIVNEPKNRYETTLDDAKNKVASISIEGYNGLEGFLINEYLEHYESFGSSLARTYMDITQLNDTDYSLSYDYILSDDEGKIGTTETMELMFDTEGRLEQVEIHGGYYDGDDATKTLVGTLDVMGEQHYGEREADTASTFDFSKYFFTDFESYFTGSPTYEVSILPRLEYYVGETAYLKLKSSSPSTASDRLDEISIVGVSDPTICSVNSYGNQLSFLKAGTVVVTVKTSVNQVEKKYTFTVKDPVVTDINWGKYYKKTYLADYLIGGCSKKIEIASLPQYESTIYSKPLSTPVIKSVSSSDTSVLDVKKADDGSYFTVSAKEVTEVKKATVTLVEEVLGESKPLTKEVTVYPNTDKGIATMLSKETIYAMNQSLFPEPFQFTLDEDGVSGTVSILAESDNNKKYYATSSFKVENKQISVTISDQAWSVSTFQFRDMNSNCNQFDFDLYYSVDQSYYYGQETDSSTGEPLLGSAFSY